LTEVALLETHFLWVLRARETGAAMRMKIGSGMFLSTEGILLSLRNLRNYTMRTSATGGPDCSVGAPRNAATDLLLNDGWRNYKMTRDEVLQNLCVYDPRNPDYQVGTAGSICYCDNCFYGRDKLAREILKTHPPINLKETKP